jgi:hypothetical protein
MFKTHTPSAAPGPAEEKAKNVACRKWMSNHGNWLEETNRSKLWSIVSFIQSVSVCKRFNNIDLECKIGAFG